MKRRVCLFRPSRLTFFIAVALTGIFDPVEARDFFSPELVELDNKNATPPDLSAFEAGSQAPGVYHVDVVLSNEVVDTRDIEFKQMGQGEQFKLQPCLTVEMLKSWGVKTDLFPELNEVKGDQCATLSVIPDASVDFDFSTQQLTLSIPQAAISKQVRGYVAPELWDNGITALLLNYSVSGAKDWSRTSGGSSSDSQYANLRPGINVGPWRFRNYTTWNRDSSGEDKWDTVYTYAQRGINSLKSQLTLGDSNAPADIFDSMPFRGGQLASDDDMMPDSLKGYAPVVRGIARTNAEVVIRQNGYVIYQSYVSPGAFEIADMYPTGGAGDLNVTVKEADGSEQHFTIPFASLPVLQREGRLKYAVTGGQYRSYNSRVDKTTFGQITGIYGLPYGLTAYAGTQQSSHYQSVALGVGKNMGEIGAFSTDVIQAWSKPKDTYSSSGQSLRVRYSKNFFETGTNFAIAGYRYSTSGYYGMQEVLNSWGDSTALQDRRRNRMELTVNQNLGEAWGSLTTSLIREDYWNSGRPMESWSASYNNYWRGISYGLTYTYSKNGSNNPGSTAQGYYNKDQSIALNVSVPLDKFLPQVWANYNVNSSKNSGTTHSLGISGTAMENNALSWNVQQGYGTGGVGNTGSMNTNFRGTYGDVLAGYSYDKNSERLNYGIAGGVVAHADGITLSQPLGETNVLVKAPGASGVSIVNQQGARTDFRGYTTVTSSMPFRKNTISLDTATLPEDAELELASVSVVPSRGALVRAEYRANIGLRVLMTLTQRNGEPVPFGAMVTAEQSKSSSIVGDRGETYLSGMAERGRLKAQWGKNGQDICWANYNLSKASVQDIIASEARCE